VFRRKYIITLSLSCQFQIQKWRETLTNHLLRTLNGKTFRKKDKKIKETKEWNGCVTLWVALPNFTLEKNIYIS
jgi:hypothetical protein